jgi:hypothetical protein
MAFGATNLGSNPGPPANHNQSAKAGFFVIWFRKCNVTSFIIYRYTPFKAINKKDKK